MPTSPSEGRFARLPNKWIYDDGLRAFSATARSRGVAGAALKVLIALLLKAENKSVASAGPGQGTASPTYSQLEDLTGLSKASISAAVKRLAERGLVTISQEGQGGRNRYHLRDYGADDTFGRMSVSRLFGGPNTERCRFLTELSVRNEADVNALKLYLLFCAVYDRKRQGALISYNTIWQMTGIVEGKIRRALSVLYEHGLVRVTTPEAAAVEGQNPPNLYKVLGI